MLASEKSHSSPRGRSDTNPYSSFNSFIKGLLMLGFIGARIPFSEMVPLSTCFTAIADHKHTSVKEVGNASSLDLPTPHGIPTSFAIAE